MYQDPNRQTGRTERMLQEVERLLAEGKNVTIYCLLALVPTINKRFGNNDRLTVRSHYFYPSVPLSDRSLKHVELYDHAFLQKYLGPWFEEFHRYDEAQS